MPSLEHETLVSLFHNRPALAAELLAEFDVRVPQHARACLESADLPEITPVEFRADAVVVLRDHEDRDGASVLAVVVEIQRGRDRRKRWAWPMYVAALHARLHCDVVLLVLCPDQDMARWRAQPIALGHPGFVLTPLVADPDAIPIIDDPARAFDDPELAVLSALAHPVEKVVEALASGLEALDPETAVDYTEHVLALLPAAAQKHLEELLATRTPIYSSPFTQQYVEQGRTAEAAESVLRVLAARGIAVPDSVRDRVRSCTDHEQLTEWLTRAVHVDAAEDLFD